MKKFLILAAALLVLIPGKAFNQDTRPLTEWFDTPVKLVRIGFTAHADGWDSVLTAQKYYGQVVQAAIIPDSSDQTPADDYDLTVLDQWGNDILFGRGADLDSSATVTLGDSCGYVAGPITAVLQNAGAGKKAKVFLWIR